MALAKLANGMTVERKVEQVDGKRVVLFYVPGFTEPMTWEAFLALLDAQREDSDDNRPARQPASIQ